MGEQILVKIFSEQGIIYGLFVLMVGGFIYYGIPRIYKKFEEMSEKYEAKIEKITQDHKLELKDLHDGFSKSFNEQRGTFESTMDKVILTFNSQIEKSNTWHENHAKTLSDNTQRLEEIFNIVKPK